MDSKISLRDSTRAWLLGLKVKSNNSKAHELLDYILHLEKVIKENEKH